MKLQFITLSGINENTNPVGVFVLEERGVEIAFQVSGKKAHYGTPRYQWISQVYDKVYNHPLLNFALHINEDWVEDFCRGFISPELSDILSWRLHIGLPFISRVQLNFKVGRERTFDSQDLIKTMQSPIFDDIRFILPWNEANAEVLNAVHDAGIKFDCLFDNSQGEGVSPASYRSPVFKDGFQGYSGGFSPENVAEELQKIAKVVPEDTLTWIEFKGDDGFVTIEHCRDFLFSLKRAGYEF